jgi:hypothetical protein
MYFSGEYLSLTFFRAYQNPIGYFVSTIRLLLASRSTIAPKETEMVPVSTEEKNEDEEDENASRELQEEGGNLLSSSSKTSTANSNRRKDLTKLLILGLPR